MRCPPDDVLSLMHQAAELRAAGCSWEAIGVKLNRTARSCRRWTDRYPEVWQQLYWKEKANVAQKAGDEAFGCLRQLLRDEDKWLRQNTAKFLCRHSYDVIKGQPGAARPDEALGDWAPYIAYLESHSEEEANACLEEDLAERPAEAGPAAPAEAGEPGPPVGG
jgi:hypothetical protein